jgi:predicted dehydrogenase
MKVLLVGANGFGARFLEPLFDMHNNGQITFEGIVTRSAFPMQDELKAAGIPAYKTLDAFYAEHNADMALISTPAFLHAEQSIYCAEHGSYVLCEKPAAPTVEEVEAMLSAEKRTGKFIAIGYQRCFSDAILTLKRDILNGVFGKPLFTKFLMLAPRKFVYYARGGGYAGQVYTKDGRIVLDSPASNACAHYMQEMLFLLGSEMDTTAEPTLIDGECLRANDITNFDTCALKMTVHGDVPVFFAASHATESGTPHTVHHQFENGYVTLEEGLLKATFNDGTVKIYGNPNQDPYTTKIIHCLDAIKNGTTPICTVKTALSHVKVIADVYRTIPITEFAENEKVYTEERVYVAGLQEKLTEAFDRMCLPSEL